MTWPTHCATIALIASEATTTVNKPLFDNLSMILSSQVSINSTLFVCAENVTIDGTVSDVFSISSNLTINNNARITQDITAGGSTLKLGGTVGRNANFAFDEIYVSDSAVILGNLSYSSRAAAISEDIVSGTTSFKPIEEVKIEPKDIIKEKLNGAWYR